MNKKIVNGFIVAAMVLAIAVPALLAAPAKTLALDIGTSYVNGGITGLGNEDPRTIAGNIIKLALGFLGVLAVVIILIGGFKWMTAGGNEEQVEEAKKILIAGVIGLFIILASWGIATFVINSLLTSTGTTGTAG